MLLGNLYTIVGVWFLFQSSLAVRRIHNGQEVEDNHPYAVYLLKAPPSVMKYKGWTCGGAIVSPEYIITSAACVEDVKHLYVVAGYKKFVDADSMDKDACVREHKKKVIFTCVPKTYELEYTKIEKWAVTDIAVIKVESPYDFEDEDWKKKCSYIPAPIGINYELRFQEPGTDALALGWGHKEKWRPMQDPKSYNVPVLHYASTKILDKTTCKKHFTIKSEGKIANRDFLNIIDKSMICTLEEGLLNDKGELSLKSIPDLMGCEDEEGGVEEEGEEEKGEDEEEEDEEEEEEEKTEKPPAKKKKKTATTKSKDLLVVQTDENPIIVPSSKEVVEETDAEETESDESKKRDNIVVIGRRNNSLTTFNKTRRFLTRRNGICQNDHGGPLVTWLGGHKILIGVASVFKLNNGTKCAGPYLFTSTQCNGKFLDCVINQDGIPADEMEPAENEIIEMRPQIPISHFFKDPI